ncbi:hypothetical protein [Pseudalkalibacillus sp. SCS-8]|uniref:hypothetical protein n=1 Tax=Pseudalkalibacillus nanhaiensis TaxID=3115291 RepID=UPI0032D9BD43
MKKIMFSLALVGLLVSGFASAQNFNAIDDRPEPSPTYDGFAIDDRPELNSSNNLLAIDDRPEPAPKPNIDDRPEL